MYDEFDTSRKEMEDEFGPASENEAEFLDDTEEEVEEDEDTEDESVQPRIVRREEE